MSYSNGAYLVHHGIKGMKWGVRRFQNEDGSLTSAGRARYDDGSETREHKGGISSAGMGPKHGGISSAGMGPKSTSERRQQISERRQQISERLRDLQEKKKERSIERGRELSKDKHVVAEERRKQVLQMLGVAAAGTALSMFAGDDKTRGMIEVGTIVAGSLIGGYHQTKIRDVKNYRRSVRNG